MSISLVHISSILDKKLDMFQKSKGTRFHQGSGPVFISFIHISSSRDKEPKEVQVCKRRDERRSVCSWDLFDLCPFLEEQVDEVLSVDLTGDHQGVSLGVIKVVDPGSLFDQEPHDVFVVSEGG